VTIDQSPGQAITAEQLYLAHRHKVNVNTDRLFGGLMAFQFVAGLAAALWLSPRTYDGTVASIHPHVLAAAVLGLLISLPPILLVCFMPGRAITRYVISVCQALSSALLIHLSGGRIETHFHIFGSLAFLAFYRDWKVLIPATLVTAIDHFVRGVYFPQSVFGIVVETQWRWLEHAAWVIFEDIFLVGSCIAMTREMRNTAALTAEAFRKNRELEAIRATALDCVIGMDHLGQITDFNSAAERTFGYLHKDVIGRELSSLIIPSRFRAAHANGLARYLRTGEGQSLNKRIEVPAVRADGTEFPVELAITAVKLDGPPIFIAYLRDITDRKKFEQQAKHAEMLALVAGRTDNAVVITDPQGRIEWVNDGFTRVTGYELSEVIGKKPGSFLQGPETDPATTLRIREHLSRGEGFRTEIVNYGKSGRKYWLAIEVQPVRNADGSLRHFMAIESDITDRKAMEEDLRASRERFELAVRGSSDGLWDWNIVTGAVYYSPAFHEQIGCKPGELEPMVAAFEQRVHPDDAERVKQAIGEAHAQRTAIYRIEFRFRHNDGHYVWILSRGVVLHDANGCAIRMAGSHTDITEQRQAAEAIRSAEGKYRGLFENSVLGIFQSTRDGHYLSANPALAGIYGYDSPEHLMGDQIDIGRQHYIDPDRRSELVATLDREGTVVGFEAEIRRTDGSHRWVSKRARVVRDERGNPLYYEGTVEDITEAKAAQAALRQAKEEAEQARAAAEAASVAKSQFVANMSHEIRTPLNGVIGIADLMIRKGGLSEQQLRYATVIKSSGDSLLALVNDILDFSKIEAGKLELSPVDFDLRSAVEDVVEMLTPKAEMKGLTLACHISRAVPSRLVGDPDRVRQNLINLVNNAIKFTETGHVMVKAAIESQDATQSLVKFTVKDTGVGIPKDRLDRLFKSFSQVDASTTRKYGGTGLGLAIVKQLAALMGGEVGVDSTPGNGSSFWFTASLGVVKQPSAEPANKPDLASSLSALRVLVVDDQPAYLEVLREQLAMWNVEADTSTSTDDAMRKLKAASHSGHPYSVALVDLIMPPSDSSEFLRAVKADPELSSTAFMLMTSMDSGVGEKLSRELGLPPCLSKPIRHSTLFDALANAVVCKLGVSPTVRSVPVEAAVQLRAHVLLAEDNEVNQEVASGIIIDAGCTVEIVGNGAAALAACLDQSKRFDIVLMDCQMPEMDGFEATRRIRAAQGHALPIIALTANAIAGDRDRCLSAGMTDYVSKPVDPDVLLKVMKRLLTPGEGGPAVAPATPATARATGAAGPKPSAVPSAVGDDLPIDRTGLVRRCGGKPELAERLLKMFAGSVDKQLEDMRSALSNAQWDVVTRLAHTIKGTAANLAANSVSRAAAELEELGRSTDADAATAEQTLVRLEREVQTCIAFIPNAVSRSTDAQANVP
jgi:PAS domain S-box-containing protein